MYICIWHQCVTDDWWSPVSFWHRHHFINSNLSASSVHNPEVTRHHISAFTLFQTDPKRELLIYIWFLRLQLTSLSQPARQLAYGPNIHRHDISMEHFHLQPSLLDASQLPFYNFCNKLNVWFTIQIDRNRLLHFFVFGNI